MRRNSTNVSNDSFVAYIERFGDTAVVTIHPRKPGDRYSVDFGRKVADYETLSKGAVRSARREIAKLVREA